MLGEIVVTLLLFVLAIVVTAIIFGVWLIVSIVRVCFRAIGAAFRLLSGGCWMNNELLRCARIGCGQGNPPEARFCRRCGRALERNEHVTARRAACW
jgi:hypothetical protein